MNPHNNINLHSLKRSTREHFLVYQLNCNGLSNKLSEIKLFLYSAKPEVFCFSETFLNFKFEPKFIGYISFWKHRMGRKGGLGILVRKDVAVKELALTSYCEPQLELHGVTIYNKSETIELINLYNPQKNITQEEIEHYLHQLSSPNIILIGDFNAHSPIWDSRGRTNTTGKTIEKIIGDQTHQIIIHILIIITR